MLCLINQLLLPSCSCTSCQVQPAAATQLLLHQLPGSSLSYLAVAAVPVPIVTVTMLTSCRLSPIIQHHCASYLLKSRSMHLITGTRETEMRGNTSRNLSTESGTLKGIVGTRFAERNDFILVLDLILISND